MHAKAEAKKEQILTSLVTVRGQILAAASSIPPRKGDEIFLGVWSLNDLLAHLVGWDHANQAAVRAIQAGELPPFYAFHDHDWKTYNARLVAEHKRGDLHAMLTAARDSHRQLIELLQSLPAEDLEKDNGVRFKGFRVTIARLLQAETEDEEAHLQQIRKLEQSLAVVQSS